MRASVPLAIGQHENTEPSATVKGRAFYLGFVPCLASLCHAVDYKPLSPPQADEAVGFLDYGSLHLRPRLSTGVVYDDNVTLREEHRISDLIGVVAPALTLIVGETADSISGPEITRRGVLPTASRLTAAGHSLSPSGPGLSADYTARISFYREHSDFDAVEHLARLNFFLPLNRFTFRLRQDVESLAEAPVDIGARTRNTVFLTALELNYTFSELTSLESAVNQRITDVEQGIGSKEWSGKSYLNYHLSPRSTVGLGGVVGLLGTENAPDQHYEQVRTRFEYEVTQLVRLDASVGVEWRQFSSGIPGEASLVFDLAGTYAPNESTRITLGGGRHAQSSASLAGQNYTSTSLSLTMSQLLAERTACFMTLNYINLDYSSAGAAASNSRVDDNWSVLLGVNYSLATRILISGFYQYRQTVSNTAASEYSNNRVGVALTWAY